jgi:hypothetical protein
MDTQFLRFAFFRAFRFGVLAIFCSTSSFGTPTSFFVSPSNAFQPFGFFAFAIAVGPSVSRAGRVGIDVVSHLPGGFVQQCDRVRQERVRAGFFDSDNGLHNGSFRGGVKVVIFAAGDVALAHI